MSDDDRSPDEQLPAEEAEIRALLADLGAREPATPPEVAARLDDTLAGLVADRTAASGRRTVRRRVVPASSQRPSGADRRWASRLLAAATVVAVLGGLGIALERTARLDGTSSSSTAGGTALARRPTAGASAATGSAAALPHLTTQHFRHDVKAALAAPGSSARGSAQSGSGLAPGSPPQTEAPACRPPVQHHGSRLVPAVVDGRMATLVVRSLGARRLHVTAYSCDGARLASTTVRR
ncbi:MAG TPA: hypothetical protein VI452_02185 [Marmoricola sp.]